MISFYRLHALQYSGDGSATRPFSRDGRTKELHRDPAVGPRGHSIKYPNFGMHNRKKYKMDFQLSRKDFDHQSSNNGTFLQIPSERNP